VHAQIVTRAALVAAGAGYRWALSWCLTATRTASAVPRSTPMPTPSCACCS